MQAESRQVGVEARPLHPVGRLLHARAWLQVPEPGVLEYRNRLPEPRRRLLVPMRRQLQWLPGVRQRLLRDRHPVIQGPCHRQWQGHFPGRPAHPCHRSHASVRAGEGDRRRGRVPPRRCPRVGGHSRRSVGWRGRGRVGWGGGRNEPI